MSGFPRDLAVVDPWDASLERSRARRERARSARSRRSGTAAARAHAVAARDALDPFGLGALLADRRERRDLAATEPWELSLGRSRARRRATELRFVPAGSRAKRLSLGALAALTVGPTASLADGGSAVAASPEPTTTTEHSITISSESQGRQVELVQQALGIAVDGIYGPETEQAVRNFQVAHGLAVDGIVGSETSAALRGGSVRASAAGVRSDAVDISSSEEGSSGNAVSRLQYALHLSTDGDFGPQTEAAVRRLQARHGLTVDGIVGPATWSALGVSGEETLTPPAAALPAHAATGKTATVADTEGQQGSEAPAGNEVSRLQAALHLETDGDFGPETEAAVRRLQARHGLSIDGVVGPSTWAALGVSGAPTLNPPPSSLVRSSPSVASSDGTTMDVSDTTGSAGDATSSTGEGSGVVARVIAAGDEIATRPYVYGGGHGSFQSAGYDCSGSVSYALHGGGLLSAPEDSSEFESYGEAGPGKYITIYANAEHAFMVVDGKRFDTIAQQETGTRWADSVGSTSGYVVRHPDGM
jgi:peptidoglycan hydrolase-like protein with peptidoglycan-binding domain